MKAALHSPIVREAAGILIAAVCLSIHRGIQIPNGPEPRAHDQVHTNQKPQKKEA